MSTLFICFVDRDFLKEDVFMQKKRRRKKLRSGNGCGLQKSSSVVSSGGSVVVSSQSGWGIGNVVSGASAVAVTLLGMAGSAMAKFDINDFFSPGDGPKCQIYKKGFHGKGLDEELKITKDCEDEKAGKTFPPDPVATTTTTTVIPTTHTSSASNWTVTTQDSGGDSASPMWYWGPVVAGLVFVGMGVGLFLYEKYWGQGGEESQKNPSKDEELNEVVVTNPGGGDDKKPSVREGLKKGNGGKGKDKSPGNKDKQPFLPQR